ncbi:hypothetical protein Afil01_00510 [Actinorhabdospora filicis]|uniref:HTH tetR-type domain-containing protein n=1 Tax=Actinorhabdospora filicis TaxID=1785913 RepID=A0A9W6W664_9ACTN|nr:TetR/AcrR family transcriptional regulator [Actinorhabdospora filicis]GLZ75244.1 hypothetical protein Afil01_00510 [Actinorhabdospora filicis]
MTAVSPDEHAEEGLRADARRNRARVLETAVEVFASEGVDVPLGEIARRAGVGAGTVYRHFPSKERLVEAVLERRTGEIVGFGTALADADGDPGERFFAFFADAARRAALNRVLCDAFHALTGHRGTVSGELFDGYLAVLARLLGAAQEAGAVRADVDAWDAHALIASAATVESARITANRPGRLSALIADALRPAEAVTKPELRDESVEPRHETPVCEVCGTALTPSRTGRPARFCGAACRQKAHRRRVG